MDGQNQSQETHIKAAAKDKFYVQCGPIEVILLADSHELAALAALDRMLQSHLWIYDDEGLSDPQRRDHLMIEALLHLASTVRVTKRGFHRGDARFLGTPEVVDRWHKLVVGMSRLFRSAGLMPRPMSDVVGASKTGIGHPQRPR